MRSLLALSLWVTSVIASVPSSAAECPGNPNALGTSRTIVVDPAEHTRLGSFQYRESLPLADKEVVITFDDGPLPPYTSRILDALAGECVKATFFMVGKMARAFPQLVRRVHDEGHTLANHSESHPYTFHVMSVLDAAREIEDAQRSIAAAVGDPAKVSPFFRFPGLHRQEAVDEYLESKGRMSWSVDFMGDDWTRISASEIVRRLISRLEARGKGMLMLHDIRPATALALPELLHELKARGYRVVHVVPASAERRKTQTSPEQWLVAKGPAPVQADREPSMWPRVISYKVKALEMLQAPSVTSFGAESVDASVPVRLVATAGTPRNGESAVAVPAPWPESVPLALSPAKQSLPIPAAHNFRYTTMTRRQTRRAKQRPRPQMPASTPASAARADSSDVTGSVGQHRNNEGRPRPSSKSRTESKRPSNGQASQVGQAGHQIQFTSPPTARLQAR
jgi:peptidoglycan/xylan/chitin deacetylase (PgdA/CDA1 family)